ncbi:MAG: FtsW/RodA/SpoVE family cell cycle protein [Bacteroidales bacterium]|nr:FtsW/RodA/SpoVE family cell cycle protein [Candidatus Cacconaster merdequi]
MKLAWKLRGDKVIWIIVVLLAMVSVLAVFSSSTYLANTRHVHKTVIFLEQTRSVLFGFLALAICYIIPLSIYRNLSFVAYGAAVAMLVMLFIPGFAEIKNEAVRGLKVGGITFQVFEFVKVAIVLYIARAMEKWEDCRHSFKQFALKLLLPIAVICILILPNSFSSTFLVGGISFLVLIFMDTDWKNILLTALIALVLAGAAFGIYDNFVKGKPKEELNKVEKIFNRFGVFENRIEEWKAARKAKEAAKSGIAVAESNETLKVKIEEDLQSKNAKVAISQGGLFGKGPGKSTQRFSLSMAFSDFIYAFIVEEYGLLLGGIGVLLLYLIFQFRCIRLCTRCSQTFSSAVVVGLSFLITCQAFLHILVNVRLLPVTGQTLPLVSHGGTAYLILSGAFGIILSVSKQLEKQRERDEAKDKEIESAQNIINGKDTFDN